MWTKGKNVQFLFKVIWMEFYFLENKLYNELNINLIFTIEGFRYSIPSIVQFLERYFRQVGSLCNTATFCKMQKLHLVQNTEMWAEQCYTCALQAALSVCFWFQFKMLVITYKVLHDMGLGYLRDHLYPDTSTCPIRYRRRGMFWVPSTKEPHLRGGTLSAMAPTFWGIIPWRWDRPLLYWPFRRFWKHDFI